MSTVFTTVDARDAIVAKIIEVWASSEFSDVPIAGENSPAVNLDLAQKVMNYEIEWGKAEQVTIGTNPIDRTWGTVEFQFGTREGTGTRALLVMQAYMKEEFKALHLQAVKTLIPSPGPSSTAKGWVFESLYAPFYFDGLPIAHTA